MNTLMHRMTSGMAVLALSAASVGASLPTQAASLPALTLSATGSNMVGGTVTLTAHQSGPTWYDWWVQNANGQWQQVAAGLKQATYTMKDLQPGSYLVVVKTLTPAQLAAHDWSAAQAAQQTVNVDTFVTFTTVKDTDPPPVYGEGTADPLPGHEERITAQAHHITNPVYQFWIDQNGHWTGSNYTANNTYTFTPTTSNFEVAVYAKTVAEPTNAGAGVGLTPSAATTPQLFNTQEALQDAETTVIGVLRHPQKAGYAFTAMPVNNNGTLPPSFYGPIPSASVIDSLIPSTLPDNGSITGAQALLAANPALLSQAQAIVGPEGYTVTNHTLIAGMHWAAQAVLDRNSNDPMTLLRVAIPSSLPDGETFEVPPPSLIQSVLNQYALSNYSIRADTLYTYDESATIQANAQASTATVSKPQAPRGAYYQTPNSPYYPQWLMTMTVPVTADVVVYGQNANTPSSGTVGELPITSQVHVSLFVDPLAPGGVQWGYDGETTPFLGTFTPYWHAH